MIMSVHHHRQPDLPHVRDAGDLTTFLFSPGQGGQEHRGQDGNDSDNHEKLDESEPVSGVGFSL
jgi:hypothetical protein